MSGQLFLALREWGATGLLLEWEDTFPYTRELLSVGSNGPSSSSGAYSGEEARQLLQLAGDSGLAVVPLVQTFGHLEFVLKHDEWRMLREVEAYPSSMCPSHPRALPLVMSLIKQIVEFHPDIQYLHIGADEVWHMGLCPTCVRRTQSNKHGRCQLFLEHVLAVAQFVQDTYPTLRVIMWDDMLRGVDTSILLGELATTAHNRAMPTERPPSLAMIVPTFADRGYHVVGTTNPSTVNLSFID
uniref:beta-N-acetylhexosaminidase n=1 Tax=Timema douglasi TaxID=61478 RepID=A0A7R8VDN0_TIMDO|nr:unnamed protein product [Timema douglasi]